MKNNKLSLDQIKVKSFVTDLDANQQNNVKGASGIQCDITGVVSVVDVTLCNCPNISQGATICTRDSC